MAPTIQAEGKGVYAILEKLLRATNENKPLTCTDVTIIEDENEIVLDFAEFTITVRSKKP